MQKFHLIIPMAGASSRFFKDKFIVPKPLIELNGYPFFYWATMSICKYTNIEDLIFIVLKDHIEKYEIDKVIKKFFPNSKIEIIPELLNGAVLTCLEGIKNINDNLPIVFNDCDHSFYCESFNNFLTNMEFKNINGALLTFNSNCPNFSYLKLNEVGNVILTVEKEVISDKAICGAYYFDNVNTFKKYAMEYLKNCNYSEYFISGVYNKMINDNCIIKNFNVDWHVSFGTPKEYKIAEKSSKLKELLK